MNELEKVYLDVLNNYLFNVSYLAGKPAERRSIVEFCFDKNFDPSAMYQAFMMNRACLLTRCNEMINEYAKDESVGELLEKWIDESIRFKQLNWSEDSFDKRKHYRNAIAHGLFSLNKETGMVHIYNRDFEADLPLYEFSSLARLYYVAYGRLRENYLDFYLGNCKALHNVSNTKNSLLMDAINELKVLSDVPYNQQHYLDYVDQQIKLHLKDKAQKLEDNYSPKGAIMLEPENLSHKFVLESLDDVLQDELYNYIKYINNWDKISLADKYDYLRNFVYYQIADSKIPIEYEELNSLLLPMVDLFNDLKMGDAIKEPMQLLYDEILKKIGWRNSIGYRTYGYMINLINAAYFCFGYLSERFKKDYPELFTGYDLSVFKPDTSIPISNLPTYLTTIESRERKLKDLYVKLEKCQNKIDLYREKNKEKGLQQELGIYEVLKSKIDLYTKEVEEAKYYCLDIRNNEEYFMTKLRNSLTHGFYSIDYNSGFIRGDVKMTKIVIEDIDTRNNDKVVLRATIKARDLLNMIKDFRERFIEVTGFEYEDKRVVYRNGRAMIAK